MTGPEDVQLSSKDSSDENCCDEDITVFFFTPPLANFSTDSDTDLVDSSDCTLLAFCSRCELAVSLVTYDQRKYTILKQKVLRISIFKNTILENFKITTIDSIFCLCLLDIKQVKTVVSEDDYSYKKI